MDRGGARTVRQAYADLKSAQKGHARGAPAYSVYVNRKLGRVFAAVAHRLGLTPNQVTAISAVHTFLGIALIVMLQPSWWAGVLITVLLAFGYAWDSADGQVARLRGGGSRAGEWLDHFVDAMKIATLHVAVLLGLWLHTPLRDTVWLLIPVTFSVASTVTFFAMLLNDLLKASSGMASTHARGGGSLGRSLLLLPTDFGVLCVAFILWGWTTGFLVVYSALALAAVVFLVVASVRWYREMQDL